MTIKRTKILETLPDLKAEFDNPYEKPSRLDVRCRTTQILKPIRVFEILKDSQKYVWSL